MERLDIEQLKNMIEDLTPQEKFLFDVKSQEREFIQGLKQRRKELGLTQEELANRIGMKQQAIFRIEKMESKPSLPVLIKYLKGLNIDITDLLK